MFEHAVYEDINFLAFVYCKYLISCFIEQFFTLKNSPKNHCVLTREDEIHKNTVLITEYVLSFVASNDAEDTVFTRCSM